MGSSVVNIVIYQQYQSILEDAMSECRVRDDVSEFEAEGILVNWFLRRAASRRLLTSPPPPGSGCWTLNDPEVTTPDPPNGT